MSALNGRSTPDTCDVILRQANQIVATNQLQSLSALNPTNSEPHELSQPRPFLIPVKCNSPEKVLALKFLFSSKVLIIKRILGMDFFWNALLQKIIKIYILTLRS